MNPPQALLVWTFTWNYPDALLREFLYNVKYFPEFTGLSHQNYFHSQCSAFINKLILNSQFNDIILHKRKKKRSTFAAWDSPSILRARRSQFSLSSLLFSVKFFSFHKGDFICPSIKFCESLKKFAKQCVIYSNFLQPKAASSPVSLGPIFYGIN